MTVPIQLASTTRTNTGLPFKKMHSLGNDFVILEGAFDARRATIKALADRRHGVGCDQVLHVLPSSKSGVHASLRIYNADGSEAEACGNGTRCIVWALAKKYGTPHIKIETAAGILDGQVFSKTEVEVTQGIPQSLIEGPLPLEEFGFEEGYAISMGNPHLVIPVDSFDPERMCRVGPRLEVHPFFKGKTNIEFVQIHKDHLQLWVWERGAGRTRACASGASAAVFAVLQEGLMKGDTVRVSLEGGTLWVTWSPGNPIRHRGAVSFVFQGTYSETT